MSSEQGEGTFEGKQVKIVGKRRSYLRIKDLQDGTEKWVDGKRIEVAGVLPDALLKGSNKEDATGLDDKSPEMVAENSGGDNFPPELDEMSNSDSEMSDSKVAQKRALLEEPKRRSVTFSPVVMTRDLDTFGDMPRPVPVIRGARSDRSNSAQGRGWYTLRADCVVRETAEVNSEHLYTLSANTVVHVSKHVDKLALINFPCAGWIDVGDYGDQLTSLSDEEIKNRGLDREVIDDTNLSPVLPALHISTVSASSDLDIGMNDWLQKQMQKVEDDIYGTRKEEDKKEEDPISLKADESGKSSLSQPTYTARNTHNTSLTLTNLPSVPSALGDSQKQSSTSEYSPFTSTHLPPVPDKIADQRYGISVGTVTDYDIKRAIALDALNSKGPILFPEVSETESAASNLVRAKLSSMQAHPPSSSDKVLDPDPHVPSSANLDSVTSLVALLQTLSRTRKQIQRLQKLEQKLVTEVVECFDSMSGINDASNDADIMSLVSECLHKRKVKRFPSEADVVSQKHPPLTKRTSDYNLFRHGSISKWSQQELDRHERNLRDQVAALNSEDVKKQDAQMSQHERNKLDKDELMDQGRDLIMKMAEFMGNMDEPMAYRPTKSAPLLEKRSSEHNLFRHGSIGKWSDSELSKHKQNMRKQMQEMQLQHKKPAPKQPTKIDKMLSNRNSDVNLFRPQSRMKWDDKEVDKAVSDMQAEMERLHEKMISRSISPKNPVVVESPPAVSEGAGAGSVEMDFQQERDLTRARCLSYDSSLLFSDSEDVEDLLPQEKNEEKSLQALSINQKDDSLPQEKEDILTNEAEGSSSLPQEKKEISSDEKQDSSSLQQENIKEISSDERQDGSELPPESNREKAPRALSIDEKQELLQNLGADVTSLEESPDLQHEKDEKSLQAASLDEKLDDIDLPQEKNENNAPRALSNDENQEISQDVDADVTSSEVVQPLTP